MNRHDGSRQSCGFFVFVGGGAYIRFLRLCCTPSNAHNALCHDGRAEPTVTSSSSCSPQKASQLPLWAYHANSSRLHRSRSSLRTTTYNWNLTECSRARLLTLYADYLVTEISSTYCYIFTRGMERHGEMAERSKAPDQGDSRSRISGPKGRGFESHSRHIFHYFT